MDKKELVEKLKKEMPEFTGTDEEREIKTALYIYLELAKSKSFDERYFFGNSRMIRQAERESLEDYSDIDKIAEKKRVTCITMAYLYRAILNEFEIKSEIITEKTERNTIEHMTNVITLKSGKRIIADSQLDMYRVQTGLTLNHFGVKSEYDTDTIDSDELTNMLIEIGYIKNKDDYKDKKVEEVRKRIQGLSADEALEVVLNSPEIYDGNKIGEVEAYKYYYATLKMLMPEEFGKNVYQFIYGRKIESQEQPDYSFGVYSIMEETQDLKVYLYSKKEGRMLECNLETLVKLEDEGLKIGKNDVEKSVKGLKKEMKKIRERQKNAGDESR